MDANGTASANATGGANRAPDLQEALRELALSVDDAFLLANALIVCLMQCGFACLEAGAVRSKNVTNIIMKNLMDLFICVVAYWLVGYALAYGPDACAGLAGTGLWAGGGVGSAPEHRWSRWFFQFTFAATAATIVSGAVAERCRYEAYLCYSAVISGVVYPVVSHWAWGAGGWLREAGYRDFAGAGPVHLLAGAISLVAAGLLGPRAGRFGGGAGKGAADLPPLGHSTPLVGIGGLILVTGFLAFNGGSVGTVAAAGAGQTVARVMTVTVMGGAGGSLAALALGRVGAAGGGRRWPFAHTLNAAFAGMVSVCAGADALAPWAGLASGACAGALYFAVRAAVWRCGVDDPLDVVAVHGGGGAWGLLSASIFAQDGTGLAFTPTHNALHALLWRAAGGAAICAWALACALVLFGALRLLGLLRVSTADELRGLDESLHGEAGYPAEAWGGGGGPVTGSHPRIDTFRALADYHNAAFEDGERPPARR